MSRPLLRAFASLTLGAILAVTPGCASFPIGAATVENPVAAARGADQRAYALLQTYAAIVEEAADIVRDPHAPAALKRALVEAERVATPAAETLGAAARAFVAAHVEREAAPRSAGAAQALAVAATHLTEAVFAAERPIGELEARVRAWRH
jgi:hypothetical protein